jgi:hypothetical protein
MSSIGAFPWSPRGRAGRRWPTLATGSCAAPRQHARCPNRCPAARPATLIPALRATAPDGELHLFAPRIASEIQLLSGATPTPEEAARPTVDAALERYRAALARPATPATPRDALRVHRPRTIHRPRERRKRAIDRATVRRLGDERWGAVARSPPGPDDRDPARRRVGEHRRGRRGPGLVRRRHGWSSARCSDQAGGLCPVRRHGRIPGTGRPARDQDRARLEAGGGRPAAGSQGDRVHRRPQAGPGRPELHQPAAAPRHLLDRGPRPTHRRPPSHQPLRSESA